MRFISHSSFSSFLSISFLPFFVDASVYVLCVCVLCSPVVVPFSQWTQCHRWLSEFLSSKSIREGKKHFAQDRIQIDSPLHSHHWLTDDSILHWWFGGKILFSLSLSSTVSSDVDAAGWWRGGWKKYPSLLNGRMDTFYVLNDHSASSLFLISFSARMFLPGRIVFVWIRV